MEKKEYIAPKIEVFELETRAPLLNSTELSFAPDSCGSKEHA